MALGHDEAPRLLVERRRGVAGGAEHEAQELRRELALVEGDAAAARAEELLQQAVVVVGGRRATVGGRQVAELVALGLQVAPRRALGLERQRHALDDLEARLRERLELLRVARDRADAVHAEVAQDLRALPVGARVGLQAQPLVGLDGVRAAVLQRVGADLVEDPDPAPLLELVDDDAAPLGLHELQRRFELARAVAAQRPEDLAGEALGVDSHERARVGAQLAAPDGDELLVGHERAVAGRRELAEARRQARRADVRDAGCARLSSQRDARRRAHSATATRRRAGSAAVRGQSAAPVRSTAYRRPS